MLYYPLENWNIDKLKGVELSWIKTSGSASKREIWVKNAEKNDDEFEESKYGDRQNEGRK